MRRSITFLLLVSLLLSVWGCYSIKMVSAPDEQIILAKETEALPFKKSYKAWYALYGLVPISNNTTNKILAETRLKKVRITTKMTFVDWLVSIFVGGISTVTTWTVEVEGSAEESTEGSAEKSTD